ncbi:MAG: alanine racemase, partial [Patescibacteria group bacterium]
MQIVKDFFRRARKARVQYTPLVSVRISHNTLRNNLAAFQRAFSDVKIAPVLKSNAYGHGLVEVARMFDHDELPFFCIDTYAEALVLRNEGITTPLLILGYSLPENIVHSRLRDVAFTIASIDALRAIAAERVPFECHLKIDTGMHRQGIARGDIENALSILSHNP